MEASGQRCHFGWIVECQMLDINVPVSFNEVRDTTLFQSFEVALCRYRHGKGVIARVPMTMRMIFTFSYTRG
ncbi:hypothetical protein TNCT_53481 [Trichonephila clavata]|uniref:Uncharacterized protein n=1 Tax=Trichonephila clavata TaxID=2740835 RepID=A0A8X6FZU3_TRICU|nr:hypothetical protein TNCT_53481 [Trichonephila clavata]